MFTSTSHEHQLWWFVFVVKQRGLCSFWWSVWKQRGRCLSKPWGKFFIICKLVCGWDDFMVPLTILFLHFTHFSSGCAAEFLLFSQSSCCGMAGLLWRSGFTAGKTGCLTCSSRCRHTGASHFRQSCQQSIARQSSLLYRVRVFCFLLKHKMLNEVWTMLKRKCNDWCFPLWNMICIFNWKQTLLNGHFRAVSFLHILENTI